MTHRLITFEGVEGVGKSTVIRHAASVLESLGAEVCITREPGGTENAELIRHALLHPPTDEPWVDKAELMLMFASRIQHVERLIKPKLAEGIWVLCDRFVDASYAYQGGGRGIDVADIDALCAWSLGDFKPGLTLLMDAPLSVCQQRMQERHHDRIESEATAFFERVRQAYLNLSETHSRFRVIDAAEPLEKVSDLIGEIITRHYEQQT